MKKIYFAMAVAAMLTACSDEANPDLDYKGEIDGSYLEQLANGQVTAALLLNTNETQVYSRAIVDSVTTGKWTEITEQVPNVEQRRRIDIYDSKSWVPYEPASTREEMVLLEPEIEIAWKEYIDKTGYDTTQCIVYPVLYNSEPQQICINDAWYTVERANNERIVMSINEKVSDSEEYKYVFNYYNNKITNPDNDEIQWGVSAQYFSKMLPFNTPTEIIIARIDLMREYNKNNYWMYNPNNTDYRYLNLDLAKQLIEEGRTYDEITGEERVLLFGRQTIDDNNSGNSDGNDENNENNE